MMNFYDNTAWAVIIGLGLMIIGGLVIWAYGARHFKASSNVSLNSANPEAEATRRFHGQLSKVFLGYGVAAIALGALLLAVSGKYLL